MARRDVDLTDLPGDHLAALDRMGLRVRTNPTEAEPDYPVENAKILREPAEIARFHASCSDLMRALLDELSRAPEEPRPFPEIEDALGWPHRRISSVLGGVSTLRRRDFGGARPYHFLAPRLTVSRRWEMWMDGTQADTVQALSRPRRPERR